MSSCVLNSELPKDTKKNIADETQKRMQQGIPKAQAEIASVRMAAADFLAHNERIMQYISKQHDMEIPKEAEAVDPATLADDDPTPVSAAKRVVQAPAEPEGIPAKPAGPEPVQILGRAPDKMWSSQWVKAQAGKVKASLGDTAGVKFLGKSFALQKLLNKEGEHAGDAFSKLMPDKISTEAAIRAANNARDIVASALQEGHLQINKDGSVKVIVDAKNNAVQLSHIYTTLQAKLAEIGYRERGLNPEDPHTVANAISAALYGPRMIALTESGELKTGAISAANAKLSAVVRAHPAAAPLIKAFESMANTIRAKTLDNQVASGRYTREQADELMARLDYIPLNKLADDDPAATQDITQKNSLHNLGFDVKLGDKAGVLGDPLENFYNKMAMLDSKAVKNVTANLMADALVVVDAGKWVKRGFDPKDKHIVTIRKDGVDAYLNVNDTNVAAAFSATPVMSGIGWDFARRVRDISRMGATLMPSFAARMAFHDAERVSVQSNIGMLAAHKAVLSNVIKGLSPGDDPVITTLRHWGVVRARDAHAGVTNFKSSMLDKPDSLWHTVLRKQEALASASDGAARMTVYDKSYADAKARGMSDTQAEFQAAHSAGQFLDYNEVGTSRSLAALMTVAPFINSTIQGTTNMVHALSGRMPGVDASVARAAAWRKVGTLAAFTLAYAATRSGDPEYENASQNDRNNNFLFPGGIKMPVAYELLPFKVLSETLARQMISDPSEDWSKSKAAVLGSLGDTFLGPSSTFPSVIRPIIEAATNHSFTTGRDLRGKSLQERSAEDQYTEHTTGLAKGVSDILSPALRVVGVNGVSPITLENFVTGYLGRTGTDMLNTIRIMESATGSRSAVSASEIPGVGAMVANPHPTGLRNDYQDVVDVVHEADAGLKLRMTEGNMVAAQQFRRDNSTALAMSARVTQISARLSALNKELLNVNISDGQRDTINKQITTTLAATPTLRNQLGF